MLTGFESELLERTRVALARLRERIAGETLYVFALCADEASETPRVLASANTEQALRRAMAEYARADPHASDSDLERRLRWNSGDWGYRADFETFGDLAVPPMDTTAQIARVVRSIQTVLRSLDEEGAFGEGARRLELTVAVLSGDMDQGALERGIEGVNPADLVEAHLDKWTPRPFVREVNALPEAERIERWLSLYESLGLEPESVPEAAKACCFTVYDAREQLKALGPPVLSGLVSLVERYASAPPFNPKGSDAFAREGAFTREERLTCGTVFLIGDIGSLPAALVTRLQELIRRLVEEDRNKPLTSTLAENVARVLHELAPDRFPETVLDPRTNHLRNPEAFLPVHQPPAS